MGITFDPVFPQKHSPKGSYYIFRANWLYIFKACFLPIAAEFPANSSACSLRNSGDVAGNILAKVSYRSKTSGFNEAAGRFCDGPGWFPDGPGWLPDEPGWLPVGPGWLPVGPSWFPDGPGWFPDGPGWLPDGPGWFPDGPGWFWDGTLTWNVEKRCNFSQKSGVFFLSKKLHFW